MYGVFDIPDGVLDVPGGVLDISDGVIDFPKGHLQKNLPYLESVPTGGDIIPKT